jgi:hypothetical protein
MKTTVEIPDRLYRQAEICAAGRGTSIAALILNALERDLKNSEPEVQDEVLARGYSCNDLGFPILEARGTIVTNEIVNSIREAEGI